MGSFAFLAAALSAGGPIGSSLRVCLQLHPDRPTREGAPRFGSAHLRLTGEALRRATFCYPDSFFEPAHFGVAAGSAEPFVSKRRCLAPSRCLAPGCRINESAPR